MSGAIDYVQFGILSEDDWRKLSVCEVTIAKSYQAVTNKTGTLFDERMGPSDMSSPCQTCHRREDECVGHFGHIQLSEPVYNKMYKQYIYELLSVICFKCKRLRVQHEQLMIEHLPSESQARLKKIYKLCEGTKADASGISKEQKIPECTWRDCRAVLPNISYDKMYFYKEYTKYQWTTDPKTNIKKRIACGRIKTVLMSREIKEIFSSISEDTLKFLRINSNLKNIEPFYDHNTRKHRHGIRPENLIFSVLPVPPPAVRPYAIRKGQKCDDDLVEKYNNVIKNCIKIEKAEKQKDRDSAIMNLHKNVWGIFEQDKDATQGSNRPKMTIKARIKSKKGRIQNNIAGKRVDDTGRVVIIGGGTMIRHDELGVPQYIADRQTISEIVTTWNYDVMTSLVAKGRVIRLERNGNIKRLDAMIDGGRHFKLQVGDKIHRKLQNGDIVLFNRQPTIRMVSFLAFKVKIIDGFACRLNLFVTNGFNAELNWH